MQALLAARGGAAACLLFALLAILPFGLASRFHRRERIAVRWATAIVIALWLAVTLFWVLAPWGLFRVELLLFLLLLLLLLLLLVLVVLLASCRLCSRYFCSSCS